jgi:putative tryptophan/tyrosine transport system substrate-binding protein
MARPAIGFVPIENDPIADIDKPLFAVTHNTVWRANSATLLPSLMGQTMKRRNFISLACASMAAWPLGAHAQQRAQPTIGFLHGGSETAFPEQTVAFREGLRKAGFVEGQNVAIEYRWADGNFDQLPALADELVHLQVGVIAAIGGDIVAKAAMKATSQIPIVFMVGQDVTRSGLVTSLNRPGGNVTGVTLFVADLVPKQMEIIHTLLPNANEIGVLANPANLTVLPDSQALEEAARLNRMRLRMLYASTPEEIDAAFATAASFRTGALLICGDVSLSSRRAQIIALAKEYALPTIYPFREMVDGGGLISYGNSLNDTARLAGSFVARILGGEKPGDLPVQQPTKFELVINQKTAKALGLAIPQALMVAADEVIE